MGTGSFLDVVTASPHCTVLCCTVLYCTVQVTASPHASLNGLIPLVAWTIPRHGGTLYLAEVGVA